jgi:hypothetical protein
MRLFDRIRIIGFMHPKHADIAAMIKLGKSQAFIRNACSVSTDTIERVRALEGLPSNPRGPRSAPDLAPKPVVAPHKASLQAKQGNACWDCGLPYVHLGPKGTATASGSGLCVGDLDNAAYAIVCEACADVRKHLTPNTPLGVKRMERIALDWIERIRPQLDARKASAIGSTPSEDWYLDANGENANPWVSDATYPDGPYFADGARTLPLKPGQISEEKWPEENSDPT